MKQNKLGLCHKSTFAKARISNNHFKITVSTGNCDNALELHILGDYLKPFRILDLKLSKISEQVH